MDFSPFFLLFAAPFVLVDKWIIGHKTEKELQKERERKEKEKVHFINTHTHAAYNNRKLSTQRLIANLYFGCYSVWVLMCVFLLFLSSPFIGIFFSLNANKRMRRRK